MARHFGSARRAVSHATGLSVHWVVGSTASTDTLLEQFHAMTRYIDTSSAFFWLAGEDRIVVQLRRYVRRELKVERNQLYAGPYWHEGLNEENFHQKRHDFMDNPDV
ncbi:MAG: SIP domain-containing protein [Symbiopectobacterium sp.]